ncbi:glycosyltransferase family protein [Sediminitomix flava]|uniref:Glycosyl transferase family 2 n=1 Tax=Sediminitomix flava TaxID=379075 RepID=A0A315ZGQ7_SEDFL|nr:glycosyltransferase family 2 protein [Sediminitomix flava]PWJ44353.1 glycosyl transferase family 2 [Sediminitomix flava]
MKISGFTFLRNTSKLYYPIKESILSILDLVDEFVIALGEGDEDDNTLEVIQSIGSDKIKIINTVWDIEKYPRGMEHAHQTDIAKEACTGDWLFYLQGDELVHEKDHSNIRAACEKYLDDKQVEGFLFRYMHFFGDYEHYRRDHCWYPDEIRIIRNDKDIHSYESAQSFRRMPNFDGLSYRTKENTYKLKVVKIDADIYHYGWVRPPKLMLKKAKYFNHTHRGAAYVNDEFQKYAQDTYDYGRMDRTLKFKGTHPKVMDKKRSELDWKDDLRFSGPTVIGRPIQKHEKLKYRMIIWVEQNLLGGRLIGGYKNYELVSE